MANEVPIAITPANTRGVNCFVAYLNINWFLDGLFFKPKRTDIVVEICFHFMMRGTRFPDSLIQSLTKVDVQG